MCVCVLAACQNAGMMELLCKQDRADLSLVDNVGATALHYAAQLPPSNDQETTQANPILKQVLSAGMNPDLRDEDGRTPLMWAATAGQYIKVTEMLNEAKILRLRPRSRPELWGRGRGLSFKVEAKARAMRSRPISRGRGQGQGKR